MSRPFARTLAERCLCNRGISILREGALRFHPRCCCRPDDNMPD
ncbi:DUF7146 domain-containing protein [Bradyrhizobium macuxiense]